MKNYAVNNSKSFLRGYEKSGDELILSLGDNSTISVANTEENIGYLDELMIEQHYRYRNTTSPLVSFKDIVLAGSLGVLTSGLVAGDNSTSMSLQDNLKISTVLGISAFSISLLLINTIKAMKASSDYEKDELFLSYQKELALFLTSEAFYNPLSKNQKDKFQCVRENEKSLSLNLINDLSLKEIKDVILKMEKFNNNSDVFLEKFNSKGRK